eukprot:Hpha_TRINITY_DN542_c0_g1::TRINITY_DN542_c0_g1_i1::g.171828::m.171828
MRRSRLRGSAGSGSIAPAPPGLPTPAARPGVSTGQPLPPEDPLLPRSFVSEQCAHPHDPQPPAWREGPREGLGYGLPPPGCTLSRPEASVAGSFDPPLGPAAVGVPPAMVAPFLGLPSGPVAAGLPFPPREIFPPPEYLGAVPAGVPSAAAAPVAVIPPLPAQAVVPPAVPSRGWGEGAGVVTGAPPVEPVGVAMPPGREFGRVQDGFMMDAHPEVAETSISSRQGGVDVGLDWVEGASGGGDPEGAWAEGEWDVDEGVPEGLEWAGGEAEDSDPGEPIDLGPFVAAPISGLQAAPPPQAMEEDLMAGCVFRIQKPDPNTLSLPGRSGPRPADNAGHAGADHPPGRARAGRSKGGKGGGKGKGRGQGRGKGDSSSGGLRLTANGELYKYQWFAKRGRKTFIYGGKKYTGGRAYEMWK